MNWRENLYEGREGINNTRTHHSVTLYVHCLSCSIYSFEFCGISTLCFAYLINFMLIGLIVIEITNYAPADGDTRLNFLIIIFLYSL